MEGGHSFVWWAGLGCAGLVVGIISGLFGVGGGFLLTPLLTVLFRLPINVAVGTGMCQMVGAATAGQIRYVRLGQGETKLGWLLIGGGLVGVGLGARVVGALTAMGNIELSGGQSIPAVRLWLSLAYVVVLSAVAAWMARDARRPSLPAHQTPPPGPLARVAIPPLASLPRLGYDVSIPLVAYLGLAMGFLSGLLGIGGGVVLVPLLIYGFGMRLRTAAATGIVVLLATSVLGTIEHARMGHVHLGVALMLLVGSTLGAQIGATLALRIDGQRLRKLFAVLVACTAAAVALDLMRLVSGS